MESAKDIIGMNYFWLIRNCSLFFCFRLSLLFAFILSLSLLYLSLCVCLIASLFPSLNLQFLSSFLSVFPVFLLSCALLFVFMMWFVFLFIFFNILYLNIWRPFVSSR